MSNFSENMEDIAAYSATAKDIKETIQRMAEICKHCND